MACSKFLCFLFLTFSVFLCSVAFKPQDIYFINCGASTSDIIVDDKHFVGDSSKNSSARLSEGESIALKKLHSSSNSSVLYSSARVFTSASSYALNIKSMGTHLVRLHFHPFTFGNYDLKNANFSVLANGVSLLSNFRAKFTVIKEFFLMVDRLELEISFKPTNFAFVNAIEVLSAPKTLFMHGGITSISHDGIQEFKQNISSQTLESVHRINVGGSKISPSNDTLWRTWIPDGELLVLESATRVATTNVPPNYRPGGATKDDAPDGVYTTAREMNIANGSWVLFNMTWDFPVSSEGDHMYFIRLHFCDFISLALNTMYFNIYINGFIAHKDVDLSLLALHHLASPCYIDYVAKGSGVVRISISPSEITSFRKNGILNGVEIMRLVNFMAPPKKRNNSILPVLVLGGLFALSLVLLAILTVLYCRKRKPKLRRAESTAGWISIASPGPNGYYDMKISLADIHLATNNFDKNLIIGSGGFGIVYKGVLRDNIKVAVKRGEPGSKQGLHQFQTETTLLSRIRHCHLVSLVGFCEEQSEMILVYEYMEKGQLRHHLYGSNLPPLSWKLRLEICIGAARGLHYLHTGSARGIIHRDIKSTNILLDENYVAKVGDFGLSKPGPCVNETHVSTGVKGSFGYVDPEYFRRRQLTDKSDVYSFGVVLFEVLCARPAVDPLGLDELNLAELAMEWREKGMIEQMMDPRLKGEIKQGPLSKFGETAEKCLAKYGVDRPSMGDVLWNLEQAYQLQTDERRS
ncbi:hypothetical protein ACS0TY_010468 [Phlomoides rotata]